MYNKIASIILNSGRNNNYVGEVFVSQPDANKERLAGKIFVLAEIEGRKNDAQKIVNFLVNIFDYNYYGDEKVLLRDKIEGLEIGSIFEGVLTKINQGLTDFLQSENLKINPEGTNLTVGVIHEDRLYFSNYGKNRAFLIYRRKGDYEIINIESSAKDGDLADINYEENYSSKIFSAVINGEIPAHSYFFFSNEALPEYLSSREMVNIITKLPPMVAAEQIKNFLQKINSFAPFLGVIIKSTVSNNVSDLADVQEEVESDNYQLASNHKTTHNSSRNAHNSISHLNYTEQKTENMLAPAGIINLKKIVKGFNSLVSKLKVDIPENKKIVKFRDEETTITAAPSLDRNKELVTKKSFLIKEKMVFRKKSYLPSLSKGVNFFKNLIIIFSPSFWLNFSNFITSWFKGLGKKDRLLVGSLVFCFLVLTVSLIFTATNQKSKLAKEQFNQIITNIDNKQAEVFRYQAVDNRLGAATILNELIVSLQNSAPQDEEQQEKKNSLLTQLQNQSDEIQKITKIDNFQEVVNTTSWNAQAGADNLVFLNNQIYISDGLNKNIYNLNLKDSGRNLISLNESVSLSSPAVNDSSIYYLAGQKVVKLNDQKISNLSIGPEQLQGENFIQYYANTIYLLSKIDNKIYKYKAAVGGFSGRTSWLNDNTDLSQASDFKIDGKITVSQKNGDLLQFNKNKKVDYKTALISPEIRADKIVLTKTNTYLLDLQNNRLINLNKDGSLVKQYRLIKDGIKDFTVSDDNKTVYILAGTTIYSFGL
jgi:hypothetical protein